MIQGLKGKGVDGKLRNPHEVRVVVTGMGVITPIGNTVEEFWQNLVHGKSGIRRIRNFPVDNYHVKIAGEIDLPDLTPYFREKKMSRRLDRYIVLSQVAGCQALQDSGLEIGAAPHRYGSLIGTGEGGVFTKYDNTRKIVNDGMQAASPFFIMGINNTGAGYFALESNLQGPNFAVSSACATGNHSIGLACLLIKMGLADAMFAGGSEAPVCVTGLAAFGNIMALSERNDSPETASRPFDRDRDGFVLSEGAGVLCLEELEHARRRGARIYAEITGVGFSGDAHDLVAPHPEARGAAQAIQAALDSARLNPEQIDLINCHATSTPLGDLSEALGINQVFGPHAARVPVQSTKSMVGHMLGAAGGVEAVAAAATIQRGVIHPTINQFEQDPRINLNVVRNQAREARVRHVLSNGFGFGGQNATLVISRFE